MNSRVHYILFAYSWKMSRSEDQKKSLLHVLASANLYRGLISNFAIYKDGIIFIVPFVSFFFITWNTIIKFSLYIKWDFFFQWYFYSQKMKKQEVHGPYMYHSSEKLIQIDKHIVQSCDYYVDLGPSFVEIDSDSLNFFNVFCNFVNISPRKKARSFTWNLNPLYSKMFCAKSG